jgi:hypothetical protein
VIANDTASYRLTQSERLLLNSVQLAVEEG